MTEDESEATLVEIVPTNELQVLVQSSGLEQTKAQFMLEQFTDHYKMAAEWAKKAKSIIVTNETQTVNMQMARTGRLFLRAKRIEIENARKALKEQSLREGKAIDLIANFLKDLITPTEEHLDRQEHFIEYKKKAEDERILAEAHAKAEEDRIEKEKLDQEERKKLEIENEKMRKEARKKEEALAIERHKSEEARLFEEAKHRTEQEKLRKESEAKLSKERAEREKAEAALRAKQQAEARAEADRLKKEDLLKKADDSVKLAKFLDDIREIELPEGLKSKHSKAIFKIAYDFITKAIYALEDGLKDKEEQI